MIAAAWTSSRNVLALVAGLALLWHALYLDVGDAALASPWTTLIFTAQLVSTDMFWGHAAETLKAFAAALAIAASVGLTLGLWLGAHRLAGDAITPVLAAVASIPKITLYPIVLLIFGLGMPSKIAFGAFHGITPIALITIGAVSGIKPVFLKLGRLQKLDAVSLARRILLPAALPEIFTGLRIGFSLTLIGTILGEMFAAQKGIGYLLMNAIGLHNVRLIMALTLLLTMFAATFSGLLLSLDRKIRRRTREG